jgi:hypothetical protein
MNITTNGHPVRATGCKRGYQIAGLAYRAMHEGPESASTLAYVWGMNDHFMRIFRDRYEVRYD